MIAVDTSALMAIILKEQNWTAGAEVLDRFDSIVMSAGTLAEALIVAERRGIGDEMRRLVQVLDVSVLPVTEATARRVADIYARWGKGVSPAGLKFGDCFAYEAAASAGCPLLFVGDDFSRTDITSALATGARQPSPLAGSDPSNT